MLAYFNSNRIEVRSNFGSINLAKIRTQEFTTKLSKNKRAGANPLLWVAILGQRFLLSTLIEHFIKNNRKGLQLLGNLSVWLVSSMLRGGGQVFEIDWFWVWFFHKVIISTNHLGSNER